MSHHHHHPVTTSPSDTSSDRYRETKKITLIGAVINLLLSVLKIVVGVIGNSQSLVADGVHSLSDLITDVMVLFAALHTSKEADEDHPYGHGRIETVFTVALGLFLIAVAGGICVDAVLRIMDPASLVQPKAVVLLVALASIASKEYLYFYTMRIARRFRSNMLRANAWHHRSDSISSVIVLIGAGGALMGWLYLDAIAAIGVSLMIAKIGWDVSINSIRELIDTALDPEHVETIKAKIQAMPGVVELHMLRTRRMGGQALVDVHIQVPPRISVSEGNYISEKVRSMLIEEDDDVTDVMVHIDPEDDEQVALSADLPPRNEVENLLRSRWSNIKQATLIEKIILHYLDGKIHVEVLLPLARLDSPQQATVIATQLQQAGIGGNIESVQVMFD